MKDYIYQIEKFLRGQMNQEEESDFKTKVKSDALIRLQTSIVTMLIRNYR